MPIRIGGMASGLDIDKLVSDLMKAERMPLEKIKNTKTKTNWSMDLYREINSKLASLRTTAGELRFSGDWKQNSVTSSNESFISVTASNTANPATHAITVGQLATGATKSSTGAMTKQPPAPVTANTAPTTTTIDATNNQFDVTLNGVRKTITLDQNNYATTADLAQQIQTKINAAFGYNKITVSDSGGKISFNPVSVVVDGSTSYQPQLVLEATSTTNSGYSNLGFSGGRTAFKVDANSKLSDIASKFDTPLNISGASYSFTINGQQITYNGDDSISTIMGKVNSSAAGVYMSYDETTDKVSFLTKDTGGTAQVNISGDTGGLLASLKLDSQVVTGQDAKVTIDGNTTYRSSNSFTIDGVTYNLKQPTGTTPVTVSVSNDINGIVDKIKNFVSKYNETIEFMNKRTSEKKYRGYDPLTNDQKKDMKEADIKAWEDKAKSGLLKSDPTVERALSRLRELTGITSVSGIQEAYNSFAKIGITTMTYDAKNTQNSGKLVIDEKILKEALSKDPDNVIAMFTNSPASSTDEKGKGILRRVHDQLSSSIDDLVKRAGTVGGITNDINTDLGSIMKKMEEQISRFDVKLKKKEDFYYAKFSAMEKAIQKSNTTLGYLSRL
ncbi:flagellar filament capping protein FliD [Paenibacillus sp. MZ04-78.2]|uniref:flagellar filament capping protein FliD n=1 Tax=Paenibacillus sp. MZ04-78.2 TaxID=2962034 RepID=UPI0020B893D3|nr:flagellar filament capping protein FliD [Paenibacillus sp. MZ04-78.2]MCP3776249.1 flagellar filament capping protein FliD [Paenibacillus sp. MZ04-78.2]